MGAWELFGWVAAGSLSVLVGALAAVVLLALLSGAVAIVRDFGKPRSTTTQVFKGGRD